MKLEYTKKIHVGEKKMFSHESDERIQFSIKSTDEGIIQMCCDGAKRGFFEVAYDGRSLRDRDYDARQKPLEKPLICMLSYDLGSCSDDTEQIMMPIDYCPFCGAENEIVHLKTVKVEHKYKIIKKEHEEKEWYKEETEIETP